MIFNSIDKKTNKRIIKRDILLKSAFKSIEKTIFK